jgi:hypothetical protein
LEPVSRSGVTPATNFNPYALQKGDQIKVRIYIGTNSGGLTIKDEMLRTKYLTPNYYCRPVTGTFSPSTPTGDGTESSPYVWTGTGLPSTTTEISYNCEVNT